MPYASEPYERCPICAKYVLPPGQIIMVNITRASDMFCAGLGKCYRVECLACRCIVNPLSHTQWECNVMARVWGRVQARLGATLNEQDVLAEAEKILREARER